LHVLTYVFNAPGALLYFLILLNLEVLLKTSGAKTSVFQTLIEKKDKLQELLTSKIDIAEIQSREPSTEDFIGGGYEGVILKKLMAQLNTIVCEAKTWLDLGAEPYVTSDGVTRATNPLNVGEITECDNKEIGDQLAIISDTTNYTTL
jgi:hypothetical protein